MLCTQQLNASVNPPINDLQIVRIPGPELSSQLIDDSNPRYSLRTGAENIETSRQMAPLFSTLLLPLNSTLYRSTTTTEHTNRPDSTKLAR